MENSEDINQQVNLIIENIEEENTKPIDNAEDQEEENIILVIDSKQWCNIIIRKKEKKKSYKF